jgi:hypothetical protein
MNGTDNIDQLADEITDLASQWASGDTEKLRHARRILQHSKYLEAAPMNEYIVIWAIDTEASCPRAAAEEARDAQTREGTTATVFDVKDLETGEITRVDLTLDEEYVITEGAA